MNNLNLKESEIIEAEQDLGIGFSKRNLNIQKEEEQGEVNFKVISNDNSRENLVYLTNFKNIISKQLPKMPKEYIVRLVFDRKHESLVLIKHNKVLGGVCYRPNYEEKFIEIAFLAISHTEQVKGYGTRLMNKLKDHCSSKNIEYFLTYADNNAIGYFKKQGFSNYIKCKKEIWKDLIKDYDGGTLMEACIKKHIEYSMLSINLQAQKDFLINNTFKFLEARKVRRHLELVDVLNKHKNEFTVDPEDENKKIMSSKLFNAIPGIAGSGWDYQTDYLNKIVNSNNKKSQTNKINK